MRNFLIITLKIKFSNLQQFDQKAIIYLFNQMMKIFRQKYVYNPDKPIFTSINVKTYNCMNTETKNKRLIIIQHLNPPSFVQPSSGILQPVQNPTTTEPFSVYPISICCSQIQRIGEPQAMYVLKCLNQSKLKNPLYYLMSDQGICCSDVEGVLPSKSPRLHQLAAAMLGLTQELQPQQNSTISKQGLSICKLLKNNQNTSINFQPYGWKDTKKDKDNITESDFFVFKGRRKQQGPFDQEYGLAFNYKESVFCRMKYISLVKDGYQQHYYQQFTQVLDYIKKSNSKLFLKNVKFSKQPKGIKIFTQLANQGSLSDYVNFKNQIGQPLTQKTFINFLSNFTQSMAQFCAEFKNQGLGSFHFKNLFMHNNKICFGQPILITDLIQKKLRGNKNSMDYFAPEMKQNIILYQNLKKQTKQKMDVWSFGFVLHRILAKQIPVFDTSKKPIINKTKISAPMNTFITKCLDLYPISRPTWKQMNLKQIQRRSVMVEQVREEQGKREQIRLGAKNQKKSQKPTSPQKKKRVVQELVIQQQQKPREKESQQDNLNEKQSLDQKMPIPQQVSSKLRKVKLIIKTIIIMSIYIFVFFRPFLFSSASIIQLRSNYASTSLHLTDNQGNRISSTTIITDRPSFFMNNDILFDDINDVYQCVDDTFDPIYNPTYSLINFVQSSSFLALLLTGWFTAAIICVTKAISIWKGGISHRPKSGQCKYWFSYAFYELTIASILFAHFYLYQFFYFASAAPCLSVSNFQGLQPFFDSSLYLFLQNTADYFKQVFSTLGILSIIMILSSCFYAWGPKLDQKYIVSIPSILLRFVPFVLLLLICRIGVFMLFSPTAINDTTKLLPKIISNSFQGFIGIIPQFFVMICVIVQILIELFMYWCQKKTAQSDKLARFFNIRKKKTTVDNDKSRIQNSNLDNSKHMLKISSIEQQ